MRVERALHFAVVNIIADFQFRKRAPVPAFVFDVELKIASRKDVRVILVN